MGKLTALRPLAGSLLLASASTAALAEIYVCSDAHGRRYTSDRPVPECLGQPQMQMNPSGTVKRVLAPAPLIGEQFAAASHRTGPAQEQLQRQLDTALLKRYPSPRAFEQQWNLTMAEAPEQYRANLTARRADEFARLQKLWGTP